MKKPIITKECVKPLLDTKYIKVYDLQYAEGRHYFDATRHNAENLTATKTEEQAKTMLADAVSCFVVVRPQGEEEQLVLFYEYRYPVGQFLLSPPAGLLDPADTGSENPYFTAAKREIFEETGLTVRETDKMVLVNPCVFSSPGMTDEANALVGVVIENADLTTLSQAGAVGTECFDGFRLVTRTEARDILRTGRDPRGMFFSVYTQAALMWFLLNGEP